MCELTVVVPTRERADTLMHTLRTLVMQDYYDVEFLISDNASLDNTQEVVKSFSDKRIRYINTNSRLSMADNWEFALNNAKGKYITYIGDDDGFIAGGLKLAMNIIKDNSVEAIVWEKAEYHWPNYIDEKSKNFLSVRICDYQLKKVFSKAALGKVMRFKESYTKLPCLYNGIVLRSKLLDLQENSVVNKFFHSISPDVSSSIALAGVINSYLWTNYPVSINGASKHSNGTAFTKKVKNDSDPHAIFVNENKVDYDENILMAPSVSICVAGEYKLIQNNFPKLNFKDIDWKTYINSLLIESSISDRGGEIFFSAQHTAKNKGINIKSKLQINNFNKDIQNFDFDVVERKLLSFQPSERLVSNIFDACELTSQLLLSVRLVVKHPIQLVFERLLKIFKIELKNTYRQLR